MIKSFNTRQLISGDTLSIPYFSFTGKESGPSIYIQAGIHGQELMGYGVALCLIEHFKKSSPKGQITIVPKANPYGMNFKMAEATYGRFDPSTGSNWNRNYVNWIKDQSDFLEKYRSQPWDKIKSFLRQEALSNLEKLDNLPYANKLARQLQALAIQHDILLDLHCDGTSLPYAYCHEYALPYARGLDFEYYFTMSRYFKGSFDDATIFPFWSVFELMNLPIEQFDMMAFTLELGSKEYFNLKECQSFADRIIQFTNNPYERAQGNDRQTVCSQENFVDVYSSFAGMLYDFVPLGQWVGAGEPLCYLLRTDNKDCLLNERIMSVTYHKKCLPIARTIGSSVHEGMSILTCIT